MAENAKDVYVHTGTYYYGLTADTKHNDDWKYPMNKICIACGQNTYSELFFFIGI